MVNGSPRVAEAVVRLADDPDAKVRFQVALAHGRLAGPSGRRDARTAGESGWQGFLDAGGDPELGDAARGDAPGGSAGGEKVRHRQPTEMVEPLLEMAGELPGGLNEAVARTIGKPAGQGGHFAPWQFAALSGLVAAPRPGEELAPLDLDRPFAEFWKAARGSSRTIRPRRSTESPRWSSWAVPPSRMPTIATAPEDASASGAGRTPARRRSRRLGRTTESKVPRLPAQRLETAFPADPGCDPRRNARPSCLDAVAPFIPGGRLRASGRDRSRAEATPAQVAIADLRARRRGRFRASGQTPRQAVVERLSLGDPDQREIEPRAGRFSRRLCATCHRLGNVGVEVGPDLAALNDKSPESLLTAILDPNRAFEAKYASFAIGTADGRVLSGLIAVESATSVTLRRQDGKDEVLLRSDIQDMAASGQSFMPEGLEKDLKPRTWPT